MSDYQTLIRTIQEDTHRKDSTSEDRIKRMIARSLRELKFEPFYFNEATYDFATVTGTDEYGEESSAGAADGYPADFLKMRELTLIVSSYSYGPVDIVPLRRWRKNNVSSGWQGYPDQATWEREKIILWPSPNGVYTITLDYTKDLGIPVATYTDSTDTWAYTDSQTGSAMTASDTNAWYTNGQRLVAELAKYHLYSKVWKDREEASAAMQQFTQEKKLLIREGRGSHTPQPHRKYF